MRIDSQAERKRLQNRYAQMSEGELAKLASTSAELTDVARETLRSEIGRRGLGIEVEEPTGDRDELEYRQLATIRQFRDLPEALLAQGTLQSAGIECVLADDNMVRMDWFISNLLGGIKLQVAPEDAEAALAILNQPRLATIPVEGLGELEMPRCPKCGSLDVAFQPLNEKVAYTSAWLGVPMPVHRKGWRWAACRHQWRPDEEI